MKITRKMLTEIRKLLNDPAQGFRGYTKEVALRVDMDNSDRESFNYHLFEYSDLSERFPLEAVLTEEIEERDYVVELDIWISYQDELVTTKSVYLVNNGDNVQITMERPDMNPLRRAVRYAVGRHPERAEAEA